MELVDLISQAPRGYHPVEDDLSRVLNMAPGAVCVVVGDSAPDVAHQVDALLLAYQQEHPLPRGIFWFHIAGGVSILAILEGGPAHPSEVQMAGEPDSLALANAEGWFAHLESQAIEVPAPRFSRGDEIIVRASGQDSFVQDRSFAAGTWLYSIRLSGRRQTLREDELDFFPDDDDPETWIEQDPAPVSDFAATLTRAKLEGSFTDTVFSFRATRTIFRPYQFKPVIKLLQTGKSRILIADEVGLGKTIEAGLIWTELEARGGADRVLIVAPSNLVPKWRREMEERFDFHLEELSGKTLDEFEERVITGRLPKRGAYIGSLERLRRWEELPNLTGLLQFDLAVFDEAHYLRNTSTRSNMLGSVVSGLSDNMVFLSATPLNLANSDLFNLLDLLTPGEFGDVQTLDERLQPNAVLHEIQASLTNEGISPSDRLAMLDGLEDTRFGRAVKLRPEVELLKETLQSELEPRAVVKARQYLADLNALSAVISRTRKVEVDEDKAMREAIRHDVVWTSTESHFYAEYFEWCKARAELAGTPIGFSMQMPLRLASACLPAARDAVLSWSTAEIIDEDSDKRSDIASKSLPPHEELLHTARQLVAIDTKFDLLRPIVEKLVSQDKQALLFTFSRPTLEYLREELNDIARVAVLHGGVPKDARHNIMAEFRRGNYDLVLANRVASEGLDFEFCSIVINYDLPWNPMEIEQRIGRIDRIGQKEEKIQVINFVNDETIDERIMGKILARIGLFEQSIGALEPIINDQFPNIEKAILDFSLSPEQRQAKANQVLEAIEAQSAGIEELSSASAFLFTSSDVDVSGMEDDLLKTGRYIGQHELSDLLAAWCKVAHAGPVKRVIDGKAITLRGNARMSDHLQNLVQRGRRSSLEIRDLIRQLNDELEITLAIDQEYARTSGVALLTATHPLVLAATTLPEFQQERFSRVRVATTDAAAPLGSYLIQLAVAEWTGIRPGREIWGSAVDKDGTPAPDGVVNTLLAALASGSLQAPATRPELPDAASLVGRTTSLLHARQVVESQERAREAQALVQSRIESIKSQHDRKIESLRDRVETSRARQQAQAVKMFEGQIQNATIRHRQLSEQLANSKEGGISVTPLAICEIEIANA